MKIFVIFVAVLLSAKAAVVPLEEVTDKVTVSLPGNVLTVAKEVEVEVPAVVVEVPKGHKHNPDKVEKLVEQGTPISEGDLSVTTAIPVELEVTTEVLGVQSTSSEDSGSVSALTTILPMVVPVNPVKVSQVVDGLIMITETSEGHMVSTIIPMLDDMVTHDIMDRDASTILPNSEDITTDVTRVVSESEYITTDVTSNVMEVITTLNPIVSTEDNDVSVVTVSQPQEKEDDEGKGSNNDSNVKPSEEHSSKKVSSSLTQLSHDEKQPSVNNHMEKDDSILSVSSIPPISEDLASSQSESSSSPEEVKTTLTKVPLLTDKVLIRKRRSIPFVEPSVVLSATAPPKLDTNPVENETGTTSDVPLIKKTDNAEDMPATIDPCDLLCTKFEFEPICGSNGLCLHEFSNQCMLDTYNCKHPRNKFLATKDDRCQMHWLDFCKEEEML